MKPCSICSNENIESINHDIVSGVPLTVISRRYNVSYESLKRHRRKCLNRDLKTIKSKYLPTLAKDLKKTIDWVDYLLMHFKKNPQILESMTFSHVIDLLKLRSTLLKEQERPAVIEIRWGVGLEEKEKEEAIDEIAIKIPQKITKVRGDDRADTGS